MRWNAFVTGSPRWIECDNAGLTGPPAPFVRIPDRNIFPPPVACETFDPIAALERNPEIFKKPGLLSDCPAPDAANIANTYATWTGERHKG